MASATQTIKRHLNKPQPADFVDVLNDICANMDNLDDAVPDSRKVAGHTLDDDVTLVKGDVGLGNVDNTSDTAKPVSIAQQAAIDAVKTDIKSGTLANKDYHLGFYLDSEGDLCQA